MFKSILVPVDIENPSSSEKVIKWLGEQDFDKNKEVAVYILYVLPSFTMSLVAEYFPTNYEESHAAITSKKLEDWVAMQLGKNDNVKCMVANGKAYEKILDLETRLDVDLIVLGAHQTKKSDFLLGTTSARIVRHSKKSVLVLRE